MQQIVIMIIALVPVIASVIGLAAASSVICCRLFTFKNLRGTC